MRKGGPEREATCDAQDALEPRHPRDGARRRIPWELLCGAPRDTHAAARVGEAWRSRMKQEHLAVGAFALLAQELAADGCEPVVLSLITRAASDEVRHAQICCRLAAAFLGEPDVSSRLRGLPNVPRYAGASLETRALLHMVEMCCLSETFTGVYLTEMLARARHPTSRAAIESLLEDEIDHSRVGWAYLSSRKSERRIEGLADALPDLLERTLGRMMKVAKAVPEPDDPALEALGYLGNDAGAAIFTRALRDVILPGFELLDVDLGPAQRRIAERGWLG